MRVLTAVLLPVFATAGCRLCFDELASDDAVTGDGDGDGDGNEEGPCWPAWRDGTVSVTSIDVAPGLAAAGVERNPSLSTDGLTIFFNRGALGNRDIIRATRASREQPFGPQLVDSLSDPTADDSRVTLTRDGLTAFFGSNRGGMYDLWHASRSDPMGTFGPASQSLLSSANTTNADADAELTANELRLYFGSSMRIHVASRAAPGVVFGASVPVPGFELIDAADPAVSPDETVIAVSLAVTVNDLYYAVRASPMDPFPPPVVIPGVSSAADDVDGFLTEDGCELWFSSDRSGDYEIYVARIARP